MSESEKELIKKEQDRLERALDRKKPKFGAGQKPAWKVKLEEEEARKRALQAEASMRKSSTNLSEIEAARKRQEEERIANERAERELLEKTGCSIAPSINPVRDAPDPKTITLTPGSSIYKEPLPSTTSASAAQHSAARSVDAAPPAADVSALPELNLPPPNYDNLVYDEKEHNTLISEIPKLTDQHSKILAELEQSKVQMLFRGWNNRNMEKVEKLESREKKLREELFYKKPKLQAYEKLAAPFRAEAERKRQEAEAAVERKRQEAAEKKRQDTEAGERKRQEAEERKRQEAAEAERRKAEEHARIQVT